MNSKNITIVAALILLLGIGGYVFLQEASQPEKQSSATLYTDSIEAKERPSFTTPNDTTADMNNPDLSPGTALVRATVVSLDSSKSDQSHVTINVDEVMEYGSSTPMLAVGDTVDVFLGSILKENNLSKKLSKQGVNITILIAARQGMAVGTSEKNMRWSFRELKSQ